MALSHTVAILTSDPSLICCELDRVRALVEIDGPGLALGLGAFEEDVVLQRRYGVGVPRANLWEVPDSDAAIVWAGPLGVGMSLEDNTPPFRFRQWLFAFSGAVDVADRVRERLLGELPDFLQRSVRGSTLGEVVFGVYLAALRSLGRIEDRTLEAPVAAQLLAKVARTVEQAAGDLGGREKPAMALVATNARVLAAARRGEQPMSFKLLEGDPTCARCGLDTTMKDTLPLVRDHRRRRSVVIAATRALAGRSEGWVPVPDGGAVAVDRKLALQVLPGSK